MYRLGVRESVMIAHSFVGEVFGPAQRLHGATYVVSVEFMRAALDPDGLVVDIGLASEQVKAVLAPLAYRNLDELTQFTGKNTTTEFLAHHLFQQLHAAVLAGKLGAHARGLSGIRVTLHESHVAWGSYEGVIQTGD